MKKFQKAHKKMRESEILHLDETYGFPRTNNRAMAGIIPMVGYEVPTSKDLPIPSCYLPVAKNCLAIQRSVLECARMKCSSIWIVCTRDQVSTLQNIIGNGVVEEVPYKWRILYLKGNDFGHPNRKVPPPVVIPIYYAVLPEKTSWGENTSLPKAILWGAHSIISSVKVMSRYVAPSRYYVSFPFSIIPYYKIPTKDIISMRTWNRAWMFSYQGKSIKTGDYLPFVFTHRQFIKLREMYKRLSSGTIFDGKTYTKEQIKEWKKLSMKERYAEKEVTLAMLMEHYHVAKARQTKLEWFYTINTWTEYQQFLGSGVRPREIDWSPSGLFVLESFEDLDTNKMVHPYEDLDLSGVWDDSELWEIEDEIIGEIIEDDEDSE